MVPEVEISEKSDVPVKSNTPDADADPHQASATIPVHVPKPESESRL